MKISRYSFIKKYVSGYIGVVINIIISSILVTVIGINWPIIYKITVDEVFIKKSIGALKYIVALYFFMFLFEKFLQFLWRLSDTIMLTEFLNDLRSDIYRKVYSLKSSVKDNVSSGEIIDIINNDTVSVYELLVTEGIFAFTSLLRFVLVIVYLFLFNFKIGLLIIALVPTNYLLSNYFKDRFKYFFIEYKKENEKYNGWFYDVLSGLREIKYLFSARYVKRNFFEKIKKMCFLDIKQEVEVQNNINSQEMLNFISDVIIYSIMAYAIIFENMGIGDFVAINIYYGWSKYFFRNIVKFFINKEKLFVSIDRIINLLSLEYEDNQGENMIIGDIDFEDVHFAYDGEKVLNGLNLHIKKGHSTAIVGQSGSGKSSIINLILKLYEPMEGKIKINGVDIKNISHISIRNNVSLVRQELSFFKESIRYNLCIAKKDATDDELWNALRLAEAYDFVYYLPNQLDEVIDAQNNLSTGQIQRIMLARVLLRDSNIIIFDEATSNIDLETEAGFLENLQKIKGDKTLIVVAYRSNALKDIDNIYYIEQGKVLEKGNHNYMMEKLDKYRNLLSV